MTTTMEAQSQRNGAGPSKKTGTAFGCPRNFWDNRYVYTVISSRARGLSVGVNMNPDKRCDFDCAYCETNRRATSATAHLDVHVMSDELVQMLHRVEDGRLRESPGYQGLPDDLLQLRHVALSGDGEPTLCPNFGEAIQAVVHVRAQGFFPFFKLVLITNASGLNEPEVEWGLESFSPRDEIWAKLDVGSQAHMDRVNKAKVPLEHILGNILTVARQRPVTIQSLFPAIEGRGPTPEEIEQYAQRLLELKNAGANIPLVQIYSATRPTCNPACGHLPLRNLSQIAKRVREVTGLRAEVF